MGRRDSLSPKRAAAARETKRRLLHRLDRRRTLTLAVVVGMLAGLVAVVYRGLVGLTDVWGREFAHVLQSLGFFGWVLLALCGAGLGCLAGFITESIAPEAGGSGIPHVKGVLVGVKELRPIRLMTAKISAGLLALTAGMSMGREGPTIHLGAACGAWFGKLARTPRRSRRSLIAAGAGAGLAAAFNAPLAGFLFVMEELRREMTPITYGTALIASVASVAVTRFALGQENEFSLHDPEPVALRALPMVALLGIAAAVVGVLFNRLLIRGVAVREKLKIRRPVAGAIVGALAACMIVAWPEITGGRHRVAASILAGTFPGATVTHIALAVLAAKLAMTVISYATDLPGGFFAPLLVMGGFTGLVVADVGHLFVPTFTPRPEIMATIGMAAVLSASVRAPLTGVVLIVEMTGQYHLLYALLVASFLAYALADLAHDKPIYEALLERTLHGDVGVIDDDGEILEVLIEPDSGLEDSLLRNLKLPKGCLVALIERDGKTFAPHGQSVLRAGDLITVVISPGIERGQVVAIVEDARAP